MSLDIAIHLSLGDVRRGERSGRRVVVAVMSENDSRYETLIAGLCDPALGVAINTGAVTHATNI
jgi:hypothetical protein